MAAQGDTPTSPIDVLVALQASQRLGARPSMAPRPSASSARLNGVPEDAVAQQDASAVPESHKSSVLGTPTSYKVGGLGSERALSGVPVCDLFLLTSDPLLQRRVMKADSDNDGRISRKDILKAFQSEASAKKKLKWGLVIGGALLAFCLLMLAANAGLTYAVVVMSRETSVQSSGVLTDRSGSTVIGTAQAAEVADLLYAYHTPAEAGAALLGLKELLVTTDNGTVSAYQVLSVSLVPGQRLECVVAAPSLAPAALAAAGAALPAAELMRIVITEAGVHEVRSSGAAGAGSRRRLLQQLSAGQTPNGSAAGVQGMLTGVTTNDCAATGTCSSGTNDISCPSVPTCGLNGVAYGSPCEARQAGAGVLCTNCGNPCPQLEIDGPDFVRTWPPPPAASVGQTAEGAGADGEPGGGASPPPPAPGGRPSGWPGNLAVDGPSFVRRPPPPPTRSAETAAAGGASPPPPKPKPRPPPPKPKPPPPKPKPRPPPPKPKPRPPPPKPKPRPPPPKPKPRPPPPRPRPRPSAKKATG